MTREVPWTADDLQENRGVKFPPSWQWIHSDGAAGFSINISEESVLEASNGASLPADKNIDIYGEITVRMDHYMINVIDIYCMKGNLSWKYSGIRVTTQMRLALASLGSDNKSIFPNEIKLSK